MVVLLRKNPEYFGARARHVSALSDRRDIQVHPVGWLGWRRGAKRAAGIAAGRVKRRGGDRRPRGRRGGNRNRHELADSVWLTHGALCHTRRRRTWGALVNHRRRRPRWRRDRRMKKICVWIACRKGRPLRYRIRSGHGVGHDRRRLEVRHLIGDDRAGALDDGISQNLLQQAVCARYTGRGEVKNSRKQKLAAAHWSLPGNNVG